MAEQSNRLIITITCPDRIGIVHAVTGIITGTGSNIEDSQQFAEPTSNRFFMRIEVTSPLERAALEAAMAPLTDEFSMDLHVYDAAASPPILVLVSRLGHCLNDLLYRQSIGSLGGKIAAVCSNHPDFEPLVKAYGIPFHYLPVSDENRREQEDAILAIGEEHGVELVVLARYMQILSPEMVRQLEGHAINIHHSFLPSFKGGRPYHQAYERGVKLIGATAHYVTSELDEGQIIEQEVTRVDHRATPLQLTAMGRDLECIALARAVEWHLSHRVMISNNKTIVFR